jgi:SulP family sulfate permease
LSVGIPARSLAVVRCGGTTPLSNLLHAVFLLGILRFGGGLVGHIPVPAIAGVTAWMGLCLLDWSAWRRLPKMSRVDATAFLATAGAVLAGNAVLAVGIGCSLYAVRGIFQPSAISRQTSAHPYLEGAAPDASRRSAEELKAEG